MEVRYADLNLGTNAVPPQQTGNVTGGLRRLELTLKKISDHSEGTLQALPISSICCSGCFSSISSLSIKTDSAAFMDDAQIDEVIRLHDKALDVMGQDQLVLSAIAKGYEVGSDAK